MFALSQLRLLPAEFRQKTKVGKDGKTFTPTLNDRCSLTYKEAAAFAEQLKQIRRTIKALRAATEGDLLGLFFCAISTC